MARACRLPSSSVLYCRGAAERRVRKCSACVNLCVRVSCLVCECVGRDTRYGFIETGECKLSVYTTHPHRRGVRGRGGGTREFG